MEITVGLQENDGSIYGRQVMLQPGKQTLNFEAGDLQLLEFTTDENSTLDPQQVDALSLAHISIVRGPRQDTAQVLELDNIEIR